LLWLLHWLPLPILGRIGKADRQPDVCRMIPKRRKIALTNLRLCMPELSEAERVAIAAATSRAIRAASWSARCCGGRRSRACAA
jgi:KDO2-lipid IV(A) lauroyltransferase